MVVRNPWSAERRRTPLRQERTKWSNQMLCGISNQYLLRVNLHAPAFENFVRPSRGDDP